MPFSIWLGCQLSLDSCIWTKSNVSYSVHSFQHYCNASSKLQSLNSACICYIIPNKSNVIEQLLILVLLNLDMPCHCKQYRSRSVGFSEELWRQLIWICTVCHSVCGFISTIWIKYSDWLKIWSGHGILTLVLLSRINPAFANSVDPDQLASKEANWSGSALFVILYVDFIRFYKSTIWIKYSDWLKIRSGHGILIYSAWQGLLVLDTLGMFFAISTKEENQCNSCKKGPLWKGIYSKRKEFAPFRSKFFPFRVDTFLEGWQNNFDRVTSSESVCYL